MSGIDELGLVTGGIFKSPKLTLANPSSKFNDITVGINTLPSTFVKAKNKKIEWEVTGITKDVEYVFGLRYCINRVEQAFDVTIFLTTNTIEEQVTYPVYSGFPEVFEFPTTMALEKTDTVYRSKFTANLSSGIFESLCEYPINPLNTHLFSIESRFGVQLSGSTGPDVVSFGLPEPTELVPTPIPSVNMSFNLDSFGSDLDEILCWVTGNNVYYMRDYAYPNNYAGATIGASVLETKTEAVSIFSFRPKFQKAMKGEGKYLIERAKTIWAMYKVPLEFSLFYKRLCQFMTDRYFLAGLSSQTLECDGSFTTSWLLQNRTEEFMRNLKCSDFAPYMYLFTDTYLGYDKYMLEC